MFVVALKHHRSFASEKLCRSFDAGQIKHEALQVDVGKNSPMCRWTMWWTPMEPGTHLQRHTCWLWTQGGPLQEALPTGRPPEQS